MRTLMGVVALAALLARPEAERQVPVRLELP